jgi:G3E family GTPase
MSGAPTDFFLLAGFLGSGKTTLLLDFLSHSGDGAADTAVLVNDVGEIGIDGAVIAASGAGADGSLDMAMLSDGCVCCSIGNDLLFTIEALLTRRAASGRGPFRRIILECSGLSRPGPIIRALGGLASAGMRVHVVSTYDCSAGPERNERFEEAASQLAAANLIVLTKTDRVDAAAVARAQAVLAGINPTAVILHEPDPHRRARAAFAPPAAGRSSPSGRVAIGVPAAANALAHPRIAVLLARFAAPPFWADLSDWLENLAGIAGERLLRVKGLVPVADCAELLLIQGVGGGFDTPRRMPDSERAERGLVIIARDLEGGALDALTPDLGVSFSRLSERRSAPVGN